MEQVSYKQRILSLIKLNKTDIEIKQIIREEYKKVFKLSDIELIRNSNQKITVDEDLDLKAKLNLIKEFMKEDFIHLNSKNPLTKKQILDSIKIKNLIKLSKAQIKEFISNKLRDKNNYKSDNLTLGFNVKNSNEPILKWKIICNNNLNKNMNINFIEKKIIFKNVNNLNHEGLFIEFLENMTIHKKLNRSFDVDLFFENLEEFYNNYNEL
jgi:hypothetical protein